jgi:TRAP-type mannitol/chloroaromatic compound transport system permease small subunit
MGGIVPKWLRISRAVDRFSRFLGVIANWLVLLAALVCALDALLRYSMNGVLWLNVWLGGSGLTWLFDFYKNNSNTLRDTQLLMFAGMVMLGSAWTLKVNEHVRVDLFYTSGSDRKRLWIDITGCLFFLIPFCVVMIGFSWPWFVDSFRIGEGSVNAGGLPRWPAKFFVPFGFAVLLLQGLSELLKCLAALTTGYKREHAYERPPQ